MVRHANFADLLPLWRLNVHAARPGVEPTHPIRSVADLPEWSTRRQVSEATQFAAQTLARWATEGRGPKVTKIGSAVRYHRDDVAAFMSAHRAASPSPEHAA